MSPRLSAAEIQALRSPETENTKEALPLLLKELALNGWVWVYWGRLYTTEPIEGDKRFDLFDTSGQLVRAARFSGQSYEFRREGLPAGWYIFRVSDVAGRVCAGKIVVLD